MVTATHKSLILTSNDKIAKSKITVLVCMMDKMKKMRCNHNDQCNIDEFMEVFNNNKSCLMVARNFQKNYVLYLKLE